jgi:tRNA (cytidine/uridine-2'-O-)-methyltransferase
MRVALFEPEIAGNVGAVFRLGACLGAVVDLIEPMGFAWDDRRVRRATVGSSRLVLLDTRGAASLYDFAFRPDDVLLFGKESVGAPAEVADACDASVRIPIQPEVRSMNLAMAAGIALGEAMRRTGTLPSEVVDFKGGHSEQRF